MCVAPPRLPTLRIFILVVISLELNFTAAADTGKLAAVRRQGLIELRGNHFRVEIDAAKGGEVTRLELYDGADWNRVVGGDGQTCPMICFAAGETEYRVANDRRARIERFEVRPERVAFDVVATPCDARGHASPWTVRLSYEVYPEGALFIAMNWQLPAGIQDRCRASVSFAVDRAIAAAAKYRQVAVDVLADPAAFESARVAFGTDPRLSYTNEIQAIVEEKHPLAGRAHFRAEAGRFTWELADGRRAVQGPVCYRNRFSLGLGSGAAGFRRTNLIGQRVYHWINLLNSDPRSTWYPTNEQIDKMAANGATILILHQRWMLNGGWNNDPHADYRVVGDEEAMRRTIAYAHSKGMRVGLYRRGSEQYSLDVKFFERYCRRDWDGFYVDWNGPHCIAHHEHQYRANAAIGDRHSSPDGSCLPARDYFLFLRRLREIVGPRGFLIGHQGLGAAGILPNLLCDAYLPGEAIPDRTMFTDRDQAVFGGMMGGGVCHPWTIDSPAFASPEGIAKMAAWGFFPHVGLGMRRAADGLVFPLDPQQPAVAFALPYWRILSAIDTREARVFNLPNQKPIAATCKDENVAAAIYQEREGAYLVIVANLGTRTAKTAVELSAKVLGMSGSYAIGRVDAQTGATVPHGAGTTHFETSTLPPWGIEGFRLVPASNAPAEGSAAANVQQLEKLLKQEIVGEALPLAELQRFCDARVARMRVYRTAAEWEAEADRLRKNVFEKVIFRGEAARWREAPLRVEWLETIPGGPGYHIKKLRYQALPGMWIPAVLYEPEGLSDSVPVVLNVVGHEVEQGKAVEYQQLRCINMAKRGMLALSVEWLGTGQLNGPGFNHYTMNQLDLCGASGVAPFYLSLERALDLLLSLPHADPQRVAVTGLSGGGWQTCMLAALDRRVTLSTAVAGYSSFLTRIRNTSDLGDSEQTPTDLATVVDYTHLTAMRAPRATMLVHNSKDVCFASQHALQPLLDAARPIFKLYGRQDALRSHVNDDPGTHNYEIDNRQAFYRLLGDFFYPRVRSFDRRETPCNGEVKTKSELAVALPAKNADFNTLARSLAGRLPRVATSRNEGRSVRDRADVQRTELREIVRAADYRVRAIRLRGETKGDLRANWWKLTLGDTWSLPALELVEGRPRQTAVLVADAGRGNAAVDAARLLRAGYRVVAVDPTFYGETCRSKQLAGYLFSLVTAAVGQRPLGIEASQVAAIARWAAERDGTPVTLVSCGPRSSLALLVAAAIEEKDIGAVELHGSLKSLKQVIEQNWDVLSKGPEFFCFGLLDAFDVPQLAALVAPRPVSFADH
jgi:dienelactone hydrolase